MSNPRNLQNEGMDGWHCAQRTRNWRKKGRSLGKNDSMKESFMRTLVRWPLTSVMTCLAKLDVKPVRYCRMFCSSTQIVLFSQRVSQGNPDNNDYNNNNHSNYITTIIGSLRCIASLVGNSPLRMAPDEHQQIIDEQCSLGFESE